MGGGRNCSVVGCSNRSMPSEKRRFYGFPNDPIFQEVWKIFTRRESDFQIKSSSYICENHFHPSCFLFKKKNICLKKNSVPTVFHRTTSDGENERIELTFDRLVMHYIGEDTLLNPVFDKEKRAIELVEKRNRKLEGIQKLCRFCLECDEGLIKISKLHEYNINSNEVMELFGLTMHQNKIFGKNACEECFQQVFIFDGYRKRCKKSQNQLINVIKQIDLEIAQLGGKENFWVKTEGTNWDESDDKLNESVEYEEENIEVSKPEFHQVVVKLEKDGDDGMFDNDYFPDYATPSFEMDLGNDSDTEVEETEIHSKLKLLKPKKLKLEVKSAAKNENKPNPVKKSRSKKEETKKIREEAAEALKSLTRYEDMDVGVVCQNEALKQPTACSIYECFFCRVVSKIESLCFYEIIHKLFSFSVLSEKRSTKHTAATFRK